VSGDAEIRRMRAIGFCLILALPVFGFSPVLLAEYRNDDPTQACGLLSDARLRAGKYRNAGGETYRCNSRRRALPFGGAVKHSIRFEAIGDAESVHQLRLTLAVNSTREQQPAHGRLRDYANTLMGHALQAPLPEHVEAAILSVAPGAWRLGDAELAVRRVKLSVIGYELQFIIR